MTTGETMDTVATIFVRTLKELNISKIFGIPSGNWVTFLNEIRITDGIDFVLTPHESVAAFMADVYWRCTGKVAACFGALGPGACNLTTGVCTAYLDRSPMLVFSDELEDAWIDRVSQMNINQQKLFAPITKSQKRLTVDRVRSILHSAYTISISPTPGPVYIGIPRGVGTKKCSPDKVDSPMYITKSAPNQFNHFESIIKHSHRPILVFGIGAKRVPNIGLLIKWSESRSIPIILTPMAKGTISEDSASYAGVLSHAYSDVVAKIHRQADVVISIGYDSVEINYEDWIEKSSILIHCSEQVADIDLNQIVKCINIEGNISKNIEELIKIEPQSLKWQRELLEDHKSELFHLLTGEINSLTPLTVINILRDKSPKNSILCVDVGAHMHLTGQTWKAFHSLGCIMTNGGSSMGFGIPAACSAALSLPDTTVLCLCGDGGFLMSAGGVAIISQLKLRIILIVLVDNSLSLIQIKQQKQGYAAFGVSLLNAFKFEDNNLFGVKNFFAKSLEEYITCLETALNSEEATIIFVKIDSKDYEGIVLRGDDICPKLILTNEE